ncbi:LCP family protein [Cellulosimicrobium marinum]|uniref:LCP family protein n=1 Tax=Cellulosimicrobium marinum TaxID=1638992 RepID=UPI001E2901E8|nr:LCP family protein [Cellulosimicrobium marinum]MCB7136451.1 LCP family protein [Cellulosimicrobium marinum]
MPSIVEPATEPSRGRPAGPGRSAGDPPKPSGGPHHARALRSHRVARAIGLVVTGALSFAAVAGAAVYLDLRSKVTVSDVSDLVVGGPTVEPPKDPDDPFAGRALNILVMGTDFRDAENAAIAGSEEGMRSDTTFIAHVSGDRTRMEVVSIPRDSLVDLPACKLPDGSMSQPHNAMFNSAFEIGSGGVDDIDHAAACTITAVQELTGIPITNHVVVKMTGVIGVVDALDGVTMCFPEDVVGGAHSPGLNIEAGERTIDGSTAIDYLRARQGQGMGLEMGSDLARIERQQGFIDAMVRQILAQNIITNSPQLYGVIEAVLSSISADPSIADPAALAGLAFSLRTINPSEVVFTELPVVDSPRDPNRVEWTAEADAIWERIVADEPPPGHEDTTDPRDDATSGAPGSQDPADGTDGPVEDDGGAAAGDGGTTGTEGTEGTEGSDGDGTTDGTTDGEPEDEAELLPGVCG